MKLKEAQISNYRSVVDASFVFDNAVTLLVGPNNCGKTNTLSLLRRLFGYPSQFEAADRRIAGERLTVSARWQFDEGEGRATSRFGDGLPDEVSEVEASLVMASGGQCITRRLTVTPRAGEPVKWQFSDESGLTDPQIRIARELVNECSGDSFFLVHDRSPVTAAPYSPADSLAQTATNLTQRLLWIRTNDEERFEKIRSNLQRLVPGIGVLSVRINPDLVVLTVRNGRTESRLVDLGAGIRHLLAVLVVLSEPSRGTRFLLIDEPETSLHPAGQRLLYSMIRETGAKTVIATHSSVFIQEAEPSAIYFFESGRFRRFSTPPKRSLDELGMRPGDLLTATALVAFEGPSDIKAFGAIATTVGEPVEASVRCVALGTGNSGAARVALSTVTEFFSAVQMPSLCVLDRDERSSHQLRALSENANIHVMSRRELENYFLVPAAIARYLNEAAATEAEVERALRDPPERIFYATLWKYLRENIRRLTQPMIPREDEAAFQALEADPARSRELVADLMLACAADASSEVKDELVLTARTTHDELRRAWTDPLLREAVFPGEELLQNVFTTFGRRYEKTRDAPRLAAVLNLDEIDAELRGLVRRVRALTSSGA